MPQRPCVPAWCLPNSQEHNSRRSPLDGRLWLETDDTSRVSMARLARFTLRWHSGADASRLERRWAWHQRGQALPVLSLLAPGGPGASTPSVRHRHRETGHGARRVGCLYRSWPPSIETSHRRAHVLGLDRFSPKL